MQPNTERTRRWPPNSMSLRAQLGSRSSTSYITVQEQIVDELLPVYLDRKEAFTIVHQSEDPGFWSGYREAISNVRRFLNEIRD
jgi:hypothetical protein